MHGGKGGIAAGGGDRGMGRGLAIQRGGSLVLLQVGVASVTWGDCVGC